MPFFVVCSRCGCGAPEAPPGDDFGQPNGVAFKRVGLFKVEGGQNKFQKYIEVR